VARSAQNISFKSVDFPAPEGPVMKTNSPLSICSVTSVRQGGALAYDLETWNIWIIAKSILPENAGS
jgi:hypothetical protein